METRKNAAAGRHSGLDHRDNIVADLAAG